MKTVGLLTVLAVTLALAACASGGAGSAGSTQFERDVGNASAIDAVDRSLKVLRQHQFEIEQQESPPNIYIRSQWRDRTIADSEQLQGVTAAQVRVVVRAQPRGTTQTTGAGVIYNVRVSVEGRQQSGGNADWQDGTAAAELQKIAERLTSDLRAELQIGVRRF